MKKVSTDSFKLISLNKNIGFASDNLEGLKHAEGEYIALLNNDTVPDKRWLEALVAAMGCGKPVIAYGKGGILETVVSYDPPRGGRKTATVLFFHEQTVDSLIDAVERFNQIAGGFDPSAIRKHAMQWDREIFKEKIKKSIFEKMEPRC